MSRFENNLWDELVREHGADDVRPIRATSRGRARRGLVVGTSLSVVAAAAAAVIGLTAGTVTPAFAVTNNSNGTVTITINQIAGVTGANAELTALGVSATAVPVVPDCTASVQFLPKLSFPTAPDVVVSESLSSITIDPSAIPTGDTLVLAAQQLTGGVMMAVGVVSGSAPACVAFPPPVDKGRWAPPRARSLSRDL